MCSFSCGWEALFPTPQLWGELLAWKPGCCGVLSGRWNINYTGNPYSSELLKDKAGFLSFSQKKEALVWQPYPGITDGKCKLLRQSVYLCLEGQTCVSAIDANFEAFFDGEIAGFVGQTVGLQSDCDRIAIWLPLAVSSSVLSFILASIKALLHTPEYWFTLELLWV